MCLPRAFVIVIVKSRDDRSARFKYINVREESTMVARLPQQVLLLLVLVTGTTTGTIYEPELSDRANTGSNIRRVVTSVPRFSRAIGTNERDFSEKSSNRRRNVARIINELGEDPEVTEMTVITTDSTTHRNFRLDPRLSTSNSDSSSYGTNKFKTRNQSSKWNDILNDQKDRLEFRLKRIRKSSIDYEDRNSKSSLKDSSMNGDKSKPTSSIKRSNRIQKTKKTRRISSSFAVNNPMNEFSMLGNLRSSRIPLFSSSTLSSLHSSSPLSNNPESYLTSGRSPNGETRNHVAPGYLKSTQGMFGWSSITTPRTQIVRLHQGFPNIVDEEESKLGTASSVPSNLPIATVGNVQAVVSPFVSKSLHKEYQSTDIPTVTSFDLRDPVNPLELKMTEADSKFVEDSPQDSIIIQPTLNEFVESKNLDPAFDTSMIPKKKLKDHQVTGDPEENGKYSLRNFDETSHFLTIPNNDQYMENTMAEIEMAQDIFHRGQFDWLTHSPIPLQATTLPTNDVGFPKRYMRDAPDDVCEKFEVGDLAKQEFYSPNYPQNYPPLASCVRILEAEKGMLLKLDFRDHFELEPMMPVNDKVGECRFDYLEVRDGQYGFSTLLGVFCDKNFPPEIISKSRFLWLHFRSDDTIEYQGFKAIWTTVPRPTYIGVPPEQDPCIRYVNNTSEAIVGSDDILEEKKMAEQNSVALDCLWVIFTQEGMRMQLTFDTFKLDKPNDCGANFLDVFGERTDVPSQLKNFCGSIAEPVVTKTHTMFIRFYLEPKAINSTFKTLITAVRDKESTDKPCKEDEYDCDDATCISISLKCNKRDNCRFLRDEDPVMCGTTASTLALDSSRMIIILVIFSLIMFGMCFAFVFNCVRKLIRDHRIIREHIRQSRENRLDEIGRKATPCPVSVSRTDVRDRGSESPSVEVDSSKELIPATTLIAHEYTKELVLEMKYGTKEMNDIHQSNNVSNATQERLQESSEEPEMCDSSCQTRESLFDPRIPDAVLPSPAFSTFGYRSTSGSQNGVMPGHRTTPQSQSRHHNHQHQHQPSRRSSQQSQQSHPSNSPPSRHPASERCSACISPVSREGNIAICPKHNPIPAPPGWSLHEPPYPQIVPDISGCPGSSEYPTYQRYQSPKPDRDPITNDSNYQHLQNHHKSPLFTRQNTVGSGERYGSFIYGSERASSNTASNTTGTSNTTGSGSQHSATPKYTQPDPRYRAEAVIEVDQKRPFSIESTKSAPDVIATH